MKKSLKLFLIFVIAVTISGFTNKNSGAQNKGKISGVVLDISNGKPVEAAAIKLMKETTLIKGTETNKEGKFTIEDIDFGKYTLQILMTGYKTFTSQEVTVNDSNSAVDLPALKISPEGYTTEEIKVESEKSSIEFSADKKIFDVEKTLNTPGGNAIDVIRKLPSVSVDAEGNISMRGSQNVKILINGKPAGLDGPNRTNILSQIPSNQIANIEIISNPGAKYDAEGTSGIINIVLKSNEGFGYNGNLTLNAGTRDKYYGTFGFNVKKDNFNIYGNYDYRIFNFINEGSSDRSNYIFNTFLNQSNSGRTKNTNHFVKGGIDYDFSGNQSLSLTSYYYKWDFKGNDASNFKSFDNSNTIISQYLSRTGNNGDGYGLNASLSYTKKFKTPQQELTGDFYYSNNKFDFNADLSQSWLVPLIANPNLTKQMTNSKLDELSGQFDYVHPFGEVYKFESGVKGLYRKNNRDYILEKFDYILNSYVIDLNQTNDFSYKEQIYSAYSTFSGKYKDFSYKAGLRVENTISNGALVTTNQNFDKNYLDVFPSGSISQKLGATEELQLTYSRRINRPRIWALNPFRVSMDPSNIFSGNPNLKPEYIDSYELSLMKFFATTSITPSVFYRLTHDRIDRTRTLLDSNTTLTTFDNFTSSKAYGAELILNTTLFKFWNLNGSLSYYKTDVDAQNIQPGLTNSAFTWSGRLISSMFLPGIANIQMVYYYSGKSVVAQGEMAPFTSFDFSISRDFFEKKFNVALRFADIFNTMKFQVNVDDPSYRETFMRKNDSRNVFLTLTYKFGTQEKKSEKRKPKDNTQNENNPPNGLGF